MKKYLIPIIAGLGVIAILASPSLAYIFNPSSGGGLSAPLDAADIADGSVSNTEFQYLNGVTSAIQTQIDSISASSTPTAADIVVDDTAGGGDYTDIQSALDAVTSGGSTIFVKDGTYTITSPLLISKSRTKLFLSGGAVIQGDSSSVDPFISASTTGLSLIEISGGKLLNTNATAQGTGIDFSNIANSFVSKMRVEEFGIGLKINDTANTSFYNSIRDMVFFNDNTCISIGGTQANDNVFSNIRCRPKAGGGGPGVYLGDVRGLQFDTLNIEPSTGTGIVGLDISSSTREILFNNIWLENNATNTAIASGANRITFNGGTITSAVTKDIDDQSTNTAYINVGLTGALLSRPGMLNRWVEPYHVDVVPTSQTFTSGRVLMAVANVPQSGYVDQFVYVSGSNASGTAIGGVYGPLVTPDDCTGAPLKVESSATAQSGTNTPQALDLTKTFLPAGQYCLALEGEDAAGTYMRNGNQTQVTGWTSYYDRAGGFGALTDPVPTDTDSGSAVPGMRIRMITN